MSFHLDDRWQRDIRDRILAPVFYGRHSVGGRYVFLDKGALAGEWQRQNAVDTIAQSRDGAAICVEEKIVRWPASGNPHSRFCLETRSNTNPGREKAGWMEYGRADFLFYCFAQSADPVRQLVCYWIDFPALKAWFWSALPSAKWQAHTTAQINHTESRLVPIAEVQASGVVCRRYVLAEPEKVAA